MLPLETLSTGLEKLPAHSMTSGMLLKRAETTYLVKAGGRTRIKYESGGQGGRVQR